MKPYYFKILIISLLLSTMALNCTYLTYQDLLQSERLTIRLRWNQAYATETWEKVRIGLIWALSLLGAELPKGSMDLALKFENESNFVLNLAFLGFNENAEQSLIIILDELKKSEEYQKQGGLDLGRFIVLTLHSPHHYYAITNAEITIQALESKYNFANQQQFFPVIKSSVAFNQRFIRMVLADNWQKIAFIAEQGTGSLIDNTFKATDYETITIMSNGQLRFAIYDQSGNLETVSNPSLSQAGKPGKCMWCHESHFQTLIGNSPTVPNFMLPDEFVNKVETMQTILDNLRKSLKTDLIYANKQDHTQQELLYISFMEPSLKRIANEWKMLEQAVQVILKDLPTHTYDEFPFLGNLYYRKDIDKLAPYRAVQVPESVREKSVYEPNFLP